MKKAVIVTAVVVAVLAGLAFFFYNRLDLVVKVALEYYGPDVTGVTVKVGDVEISPHDGRGRVRNLELGNPAGFSASRSVRLGDVIVEIEPATLRAPVVHIRAIGIEAPIIVYERGNKATNLETIARSMEAYAKRSIDQETAASGAQRTKRRFVIDRLLIRGAKVTMTAPALRGQGATFDLPDFELHDIGKRQNGVTASEAASIVTNAVIARIAQRVLSNVDLLRKGGIEGALDALKGLVR
ncbi:MAG TPA: hypothetical protein VM051_10920 [Usitatibacter sp.]|nr:hypothetical protein [Usitatibacter sp.]